MTGHTLDSDNEARECEHRRATPCRDRNGSCGTHLSPWAAVLPAGPAPLDREPSLDEAWARAEAALPEKQSLTLYLSEKGWHEYGAWAQDGSAGVYDEDGEYIVDNPTLLMRHGRTPAAALNALADAYEREP